MKILKDGINDEDYLINKDCKSCEYNVGTDKKLNGYRECWKDLWNVEPHIFDLYFGGAIKGENFEFYLDELIEQKKVSFFDLNPERFKNSKGQLSKRGERQFIQYQHTKENSEYIDKKGLCGVFEGLKYPLHFIDFETYLSAIF